MLKRFCTFLFMIHSFIYYGQSSQWNLQQCIDFGQKNNISLKQAELTTQINKNNLTQSNASVLPTINGGAQHTYNFGRTIDRYTNTFANSQVLSQNFYISSNVILWSGLAQYNNIKANQFQYLSSNENFLQQKNDLALNIATAYINVIFSDEILQVSKNQFKITQEQLERSQKLADAGSISKNTIYDLKAQLANDDVNVITSDNNYQLALLSLKQLLNLDTLSNFSIEKPPINISENDLTSLSIQNIFEAALKNQHTIKAAQYNMLAAGKSLEVAKGKFSPTLSATGSLGTGTSELNKRVDAVNFIGIEKTPYITSSNEVVFQPKTEVITSKTPFANQFNDNVNKSIGFTVSIPIFNGLQTYTSYKNAKLNALSVSYGKDLAEQNLYKTIAQALANSRAALNKYKANRLLVESSQLSFNFAEQKYNLGAISTFDYNSAKTRLQSAQSNLIQAKYDYVFKLKVLDYYQGKPISF